MLQIRSASESLIDTVFDHIDSYRFEQADETVRLHLLDTLGCGLYGSTLPEAVSLFEGASAYSPRGGVRVWGTKQEFPVDTAALICGTLCHLRELDDVHTSALHPGAVCVSAALAVAVWEKRTLADLLRALAGGVEVMVRINTAMDYHSHRMRGWHGTGTCGAFGAAFAAGSLLNLDKKHMVQALGLAGSRTGGTWAFSADGSMSKRLHPGLAAQSGIISAYMAARDITGPKYILEHSDGGFYTVTTDSWQLEKLTALSENLAIEKVDYKQYAACRSAHASIEASIELFKQFDGRSIADISEIVSEVSSVAIAMAGRMYDPAQVASAQLSIPYGIALGLTGRKGDPLDYVLPVMQNDAVYELACKVVVRESDMHNTLRRTKNKNGATVTVHFKDGSDLSVLVTDPLGSVENPLRRKDLIDKFHRLASCALSSKEVETLEEQILNGDKKMSVCDLLL